MPLTSHEIAAIRAYSGTAYRTINDYLRNEGSGDPVIEAQVHHLDQALVSNPSSVALIVYRGVSEAFAARLAGRGLAAGDIILDRAFLSTSRHQDVASAFMRDEGGMILAIGIPASMKALDIAEFSTYPSEAETLVARNASLRVIGYDASADILELEMLGDE